MKIIKRIPRPLYKKIYSCVPILCVEAVVKDPKGNFLLVKRKTPPTPRQWWFPGGRMYKFEPSIKAVTRVLKQETGIIGKAMKLLGIHEGIYRQGHFPGISCHTPTLVYLVNIQTQTNVTLDSTSIDYRWFNKINSQWNVHIKKFLRLAEKK